MPGVIALRRRLGQEEGVTLIELLVSILIGMVVLSGVLSLTEVGARSTARTTDRADAVQRSRTAMNQIVQSLRSQVCPAATVPPIATATRDLTTGVEQLTFYTEMDDLPVNTPQPTFAPQKRRLTFDPRNSGSIVEDVYNPTSTTPPFAWNSTPTRSKTLATRVNLISSTTPFFRYYGFENSLPLSLPLSTSTTVPVPGNSIAKVIKIEVAFEARPSTGHTEASRAADATTTIQTRNTDYTNQTDPANQRRWGPRCD